MTNGEANAAVNKQLRALVSWFFWYNLYSGPILRQCVILNNHKIKVCLLSPRDLSSRITTQVLSHNWYQSPMLLPQAAARVCKQRLDTVHIIW